MTETKDTHGRHLRTYRTTSEDSDPERGNVYDCFEGD